MSLKSLLQDDPAEPEKPPEYTIGSQPRKIFGMTRTEFWLALALALVILAGVIGGAIGGTLAVKNSENAASHCTSGSA
jgi:hypothetical protein